MMVIEQRLVTLTEASREFGVSTQTIRVWIAKGIVKGYKQDAMKRYLVDANEIAAKLQPRELPIDTEEQASDG